MHSRFFLFVCLSISHVLARASVNGHIGHSRLVACQLKLHCYCCMCNNINGDPIGWEVSWLSVVDFVCMFLVL